MRTLDGKVVAITGAASGIGRALAQRFAREGAILALADRDAGGLAATAAPLADAGIRLSQHVVDVADRSAVARFARETVAAHGRADVLINNAGVALYGSVMETDEDELRWLMEINFWGVVHGVRAFLPALLTRPEAAIVNVSSLFGLYAPAGQSAYAASKFAVRGFSESLRAELRRTPVHVVTVHPAGIRTAIARSSRVAAAADPARAAAASRAFEQRFLTIPPETAAEQIVRAIVRRRDRVLIGADAVRVDLLTRLLGPAAQRLFERGVPFDPARNGPR